MRLQTKRLLFNESCGYPSDILRRNLWKIKGSAGAVGREEAC